MALRPAHRSLPGVPRRLLVALLAAAVFAPVLIAGCASSGGPRAIRSEDAPTASGAEAIGDTTPAAQTGGGDAGTAVTDPSLTVIDIASTLTFTDDPPTTSSALIPAAAGGSLTVTASDGTTFTLDVPADALVVDTTITGTASTTAAGIDAAVSMHAVRFEPERLQFIAGASLRVTAAAIGTEGHQLPFQAAGDGSDLRIAMLEQQTDGTTLVVSHFSTFGIAILDQLVSEITVRRPAAAAEVSLWNDIAVAISIRKEILRLGQSSAVLDLALQNLFTSYMDRVIIPLIEGADGTCTAAIAVAQSTRHYYDIWIHNSLPSGIGSLKAVAQSAFLTMETLCEKERIDECKQTPDRTILVNFWREMRTWRAALGLAQKPGDSPASENRRASDLCDSFAYTFTGGIDDFQVVDGLVCDVRKMFVLTAPGIGQSQHSGGQLVFEESDLGVTLTGPYTLTGIFNAFYSGNFTISLPGGPGQAGTMSAFSGGQIAGEEGSGTEEYTLTPAKGQCL